MNYIAHIRENDKQIQTVEEHLCGVKALSESFGNKIGVKHIAGLAGMLHDLGKYTEEFRNYIYNAVFNPSISQSRGEVDHSSAGGKLLYERLHTGNLERNKAIVAEVVGNAIISHHSSSLNDFLSPDLESKYLYRVRDKPLVEFDITAKHFFDKVMSRQEFDEYVEMAAEELNVYLAKNPSIPSEEKLMFLTKFIFSTLIDADRTNTRLFEENRTMEREPNTGLLFEGYFNKLMNKLRLLQGKQDANSHINQLRREMSECCEQFADKPSGVFSLSIPTGGGKTLASLRYALKHAIRYGKKHIIYVVPYTTIIEQNAAEVRRILEDDSNILEHHSNVIDDVDDNDEDQDGRINVQQKLKLAKDNWDSPIIFTTMVQFLNVFYAKGSRYIRRLHHLCESVIIFDEVQKVPTPCVSLFNQALNFLSAYCKSSIVLCTATQPALDFVEHKLDINTDAEIIDQLGHVMDAFKRVEIIDKATDELFNNDKLVEFISMKLECVLSVLIVLNTKSVVRRLYQQLQNIDNDILTFHLSTSMCAAHRNQILTEIRNRLINKERIVCISTQLIEAGVDISFECVIRSLAGVDSIAQAAGRCNRHGEAMMRQVYVIDHEEEKLDRLKEIKVGKQIAKRILIDLKRDTTSHGGNLLSVQAMNRYFMEYYNELGSDLNYSIPGLSMNMVKLLTANKGDNEFFPGYTMKHGTRLPLMLANSYRTAADHFKVIDNMTTSVIVPYGEGEEIIAELTGNASIEHLGRLLRRAQQYTINLFDDDLRQLSKSNGIVSCLDGKVLVLKDGAYNREYGLDVFNDSYSGLIM